MLSTSLLGVVLFAQDAPQDRYQVVEHRIWSLDDLPVGALSLWLSPMSPEPQTGAADLEQLQHYGRFVRVEDGETVELIALRYGRRAEKLRLLNGLEENQEPAAGTILGISFYHRVLPGERFEDIAELYGTTPELLRAANPIQSGECPVDWSKVDVPIPWANDDQTALRLPVPRWQRLAEGQPLEFRHGFVRRVIEEGDTWLRLSRLTGSRPDVLRNVNGEWSALPWADSEIHFVPATDPPPMGEEVRIAATLDVPEDLDPVTFVLFLEHFLRVDLDVVLGFHPEDTVTDLLAKHRKVRVPFSGSRGFAYVDYGGGRHPVSFPMPGVKAEVRPWYGDGEEKMIVTVE